MLRVTAVMILSTHAVIYAAYAITTPTPLPRRYGYAFDYFHTLAECRADIAAAALPDMLLPCRRRYSAALLLVSPCHTISAPCFDVIHAAADGAFMRAIPLPPFDFISFAAFFIFAIAISHASFLPA